MMTKILGIAAAAAVALTAGRAEACSCMQLADSFFATVAKRNELANTEGWSPLSAVVTGKVIGYSGEGFGGGPLNMLVEVSHVLQGSVASKVITVRGDDGMSCSPYVSMFPVGTTWTFAIDGESEKLYISVCGEYWLKTTEPPANR